MKREEFEKLGQTQKEKEKFTKIMLMEDNDARRRMSELCMQQKKMIVNPIIDWTHSDIWGYINSEKIETCELYQCGYDRVGCIGCLMAGKKRYKEFADFPGYKKLYIHAFERMLQERTRRGKENTWKTGINTALTRKELNIACEKIKNMTLDTMMVIAVATLHDEFGFAGKRCKRFIDRMNLKAECLVDDMATWDEYTKMIKDEIGIEMTIRRND